MPAAIGRTILSVASIVCAGVLAWKSYSTGQWTRSRMDELCLRSAGMDPVGHADRYWSQVHKLLVNQPCAGFVNTRPSPWKSGQFVAFSDREDGLAFTRLQYAVAPTVLIPDPSLPWIVARFDTQQEMLQFAAQSNYQIMANPSAGKALLQRRTSP